MDSEDEGTRHHRLTTCLLLVLLIFVCVGASASAQQPANGVGGGGDAKTNGQPRKATLQEIYGMFFAFAAHVEARSNEDEKHGIDRTFYRHHLQKASRLKPAEYALVLAAAQRFVAVDADVNRRIDELNKAVRVVGTPPHSESESESDDYRGRMASLYSERNSALDAEIANLRQALGPERADVLNAYLHNGFPSGTRRASHPSRIAR